MTAVPMKTDAPCVVLVTPTNSVNINKARSASCEGSEAAEEMSQRSRSSVRRVSSYASAPKREIKIKRVFVSREDNYAAEARLHLKCQKSCDGSLKTLLQTLRLWRLFIISQLFVFHFADSLFGRSAGTRRRLLRGVEAVGGG